MLRRMTRDRYLSDDELERFLAAVRGRRHVHRDRDLALFVLLANTGMRPSEALGLRREDVHLTGRRPWLRLRRESLPHRPRPTNDIELNRKVADVLKSHADTVEPHALLWPVTRRQSERLFRYYASKAGIPGTRPLFCLRHTVGIRLYRHTKDLRFIQALMGHRWLKAANSYVHTSQETVRSALEHSAA